MCLDFEYRFQYKVQIQCIKNKLFKKCKVFMNKIMFVFIRTKDAVKHFEVKTADGELSFGFGTFSTIQEFVEHFETQPLVAGENGKYTCQFTEGF